MTTFFELIFESAVVVGSIFFGLSPTLMNIAKLGMSMTRRFKFTEYLTLADFVAIGVVSLSAVFLQDYSSYRGADTATVALGLMIALDLGLVGIGYIAWVTMTVVSRIPKDERVDSGIVE
jgi:hypothetical protein